jgi:citrate lyase subunit beta / citryl-CoA lyase
MNAVTGDPQEQVRQGVTFLFVPGDRPERFMKASTSGADVVIIDLEDAVAPGAQEAALRNAVDALTATEIRALVRIHPVDSPHHDEQIRALAALPDSGLLGVMLAKAEGGPDVIAVRAALSESLAVIPLVESAAGLIASLEMALVPGISRLAFGAVDFSLDIGSDSDHEYLAYARSGLVVSSRAARIAPPLESPSLEIADVSAVSAAARRARGFGFGGMLAIHPAQLPSIREGFAPTSQDAEWAHAVLAAEGGAVQVNGQLVDRPVTERARNILARAGAQ